MKLGRRVILAIALTLIVTIGNEGCRGQNDESSSNESMSDESTGDDSSRDYVDNEIDLVPTYRSGIEKALQGLLSVVSGGSSSSSSSESSGSGGIGRFFGSVIPNPIKKIIAPVKSTASRGFGEVLNLFEKNFHAIFPGTVWCGGGNIASSEEDVGLFERTDACCRAHDNCPSNINAGDTLGPLINNGIFTRSACSCDHEFYSCLKNVSSVVSANIGSTYFNILRPQCFAYDYPKECAEYGDHRIVNKKCVRYTFDVSQNKSLEWFDNLDF